MSWSEQDLVAATAGRLVARAELRDSEVTALVRSVVEESDGQRRAPIGGSAHGASWAV